MGEVWIRSWKSEWLCSLVWFYIMDMVCGLCTTDPCLLVSTNFKSTDSDEQNPVIPLFHSLVTVQIYRKREKTSSPVSQIGEWSGQVPEMEGNPLWEELVKCKFLSAHPDVVSLDINMQTSQISRSSSNSRMIKGEVESRHSHKETLFTGWDLSVLISDNYISRGGCPLDNQISSWPLVI